MLSLILNFYFFKLKYIHLSHSCPSPSQIHGLFFYRFCCFHLSPHRSARITDVSNHLWFYMGPGDANSGPQAYPATSPTGPVPRRRSLVFSSTLYKFLLNLHGALFSYVGGSTLNVNQIVMVKEL